MTDYRVIYSDQAKDAIENNTPVQLAVNRMNRTTQGVSQMSLSWKEMMQIWEEQCPDQYVYDAYVKDWETSSFGAVSIEKTLKEFITKNLTRDKMNISSLIFVDELDMTTIRVIVQYEMMPVFAPDDETNGLVPLFVSEDGTSHLFPNLPSQPLGPNGETRTVDQEAVAIISGIYEIGQEKFVEVMESCSEEKMLTMLEGIVNSVVPPPSDAGIVKAMRLFNYMLKETVKNYYGKNGDNEM